MDNYLKIILKALEITAGHSKFKSFFTLFNSRILTLTLMDQEKHEKIKVRFRYMYMRSIETYKDSSSAYSSSDMLTVSGNISLSSSRCW